MTKPAKKQEKHERGSKLITEKADVPKMVTAEAITKTDTQDSIENSDTEENYEAIINSALAVEVDNENETLDHKVRSPSMEMPNSSKKIKKVKRLDMDTVVDFNAKLHRRGVLYIARIPPRMGPSKVKALLSTYGTITRVYLVEEDAAVRKRRRQNSGSKGGGKRYVEGWVEFEDRKIAERVGMCLNNTPISNYKRSALYGDLWNVKFLKKFKWSHLTEKVAYERRVKEHKLKIEMMQVKKENASYRNLVEKGQTMDRIEERRKRKNITIDDYEKRFKFRQTAPMAEKESTMKNVVLSSLVNK